MANEERRQAVSRTARILAKAAGRAIVTVGITDSFSSDSYRGEEMRLGFDDGSCLYIGISSTRGFLIIDRLL